MADNAAPRTPDATQLVVGVPDPDVLEPQGRRKTPEAVLLVVLSQFVDNFDWHYKPGTETDGVEDELRYRVTREGTAVPAELAGSLIDSALASGVLVTVKD